MGLWYYSNTSWLQKHMIYKWDSGTTQTQGDYKNIMWCTNGTLVLLKHKLTAKTHNMIYKWDSGTTQTQGDYKNT